MVDRWWRQRWPVSDPRCVMLDALADVEEARRRLGGAEPDERDRRSREHAETIAVLEAYAHKFS